MTTEENKRMLALSYIVADLKAENIELAQRVHQLVIECNNVSCQSNGKEKRKGKDYSKQTLDEMQQLREQCDKLKRENQELERFAIAIHGFANSKKLYTEKDIECPYFPEGIPVCSSYCLECSSCLGVIEGVGVLCEKRLQEASVSLPDIG